MKKFPLLLQSAITRLRPAATALLAIPSIATSAPTAVNADFSYALTTQNDPARPGEPVPVAITITNITASAKSAQISFVMPNHVAAGGYDPGDIYNFSSTSVPAGTSKTFQITPTVYSGATAPADGTLIDFLARDVSRAIVISRTIEVQSARQEELKLSTPTGSVAPGGDFTYTLAYHNGRPSPISGAKLSLAIPAGAAFVSADSGGTVSNGAVGWALGTLDAGKTGQVQVRFTAPASAGAALLMDATLLDSVDQVLAQASDVKTMAAAPVFAYSISVQNDTAKPDEKVPFALTVTNLTATTQTTDLTFEIPNYAQFGGYDPGDTYPFSRLTVAAGASQTVTIAPTIHTGANAPPDGSILNFLARDPDRGACVSRSIVVQSAPAAGLKLSTTGGSVAPGANFTHTLAYHNSGIAPISGAKLSLPVPAGATFLSADGGGTLNSGGVEWSLGNLAGFKTGQVQVTFTAPPSLSAHLFLDARLRNSAGALLAQASDVKTMATAPTFSYSLTTQGDPAGPGEKFPLAITVTNLTNAPQTTDLTFEMPNYAEFGGYDPGDTYSFSRLTVAAGASQTVTIAPTITNGAAAPPDGTLLHFVARDMDRGATVSRSTVTQSTLTADLKLSTGGGTVAPGETFDYTLAYHNGSASPISGAKLSLPVPAGATFVSADAGGTQENGVVSWTLGDLPGSKTGQVNVIFSAPAVLTSHLLLDARLRNGANEVLAQASDVKSMASFPAFTYALSTQVDTLKPGETAPLAITVTNLTNSTQTTDLELEIPNYSQYGGYDPGDTYSFSRLTVAAGASQTVTLTPTVTSGANAASDGSILNFIMRDPARGVSVSRNIVVQSSPKADLKLSASSGTVPLGGSFSKTLTYHNSGSADIVGTKLVLSVPAGVTFVSADAGGNLVDGMVVWDLGATSPGFTGKVKADFSAPVANKSALLMNAKLLNGSNELLAHASDVKAIYDFPVFSYELIPPTSVVLPGGPASYLLKITNLTNSTQSAGLSFTFPRHTPSGGYDPGDTYTFSTVNVASLASTSLPIDLLIANGTDTPPDGSLVNLIVRDAARGVSLSHTVAVNRKIYTYGTIIRTMSLSGNLNFGKIPVGQSATRTLTIGNTGISPLTISKITFPTGFSGSFAGTIPAGGSTNVSVTFKPTAGKSYAGNLTISSNKTDGVSQMAITGTGANRSIKLGGNLDFGKVLVFSKKTLNLTISNTGNEPLMVTKLVLPAGFKGSFAGVIKPGETKKVPVTFQPTKLKNYSGKLTVTSNKTQGANIVSLAGQGK